MLSVRPEWAEKIASGKKTMELRIRVPLKPTPFPLALYCTRREQCVIQLPGGWEADVSGMVFGEAVCSAIYYALEWRISPGNVEPVVYRKITNAACVSDDELYAYARARNVYAIGMINVRVFAIPRELRDYGIDTAPQSWCYFA